ncbi:MAG: hypothetical protein GWP91_01295 [Rhodobacterales bacterium]|nr:hypothetical protein [Rhodobacterales bacterium]
MRALVLLFLFGGCTKLPTTWNEVEDFPILEDKDHGALPPVPDNLRVMTWNLKFGGGRIDFFFDGHGERVHMTEKEVEDNLQGILALIDEQDPDILMAQEVDVASARSAYVDMAQEILDRTDFNYAAWVPAWQVDFIPQDGLGPVKMGQTVFSKWPITRNTRADLPQSEESSAVVNYFWLHRCIQIVEIDLEGTPLGIVNNHPAAYALDGTKQKHLKRIFDETQRFDGLVISGGDFNVIPPGSLITEDFADSAPANVPGVSDVFYTEDEMASLEPFYEAYNAAVPIDDYQGLDAAGQAEYFSHSISGDVFWVVKLDYLFSPQTWFEAHTLQKPGDGNPPTASDPMSLSDHAPVVAVLELP